MWTEWHNNITEVGGRLGTSISLTNFKTFFKLILSWSSLLLCLIQKSWNVPGTIPSLNQHIQLIATDQPCHYDSLCLAVLPALINCIEQVNPHFVQILKFHVESGSSPFFSNAFPSVPQYDFPPLRRVTHVYTSSYSHVLNLKPVLFKTS